MLFNSLEFLIFFPTVTLLYYIFPHRYRWALLLTASCIFYMFFIPIYILVLFATILIDYFAALQIEATEGNNKRKWLLIAIVSTILVLFIFKYFNFINDNLIYLSHLIHWNYPIQSLAIILPLGLSFHTFQSLSYVIEVYRGEQKAERHIGIFSLYVMFYPQLVAGPIERPQNLLHQFYEDHKLDYSKVTSGLKLMALGMFKKVVIADRLAPFVNHAYSNPYEIDGASLTLATVFFAFQIYCDFSGYSDIAIGSARVMGFHLMENFNAPYLAKSIADFWRRWHISLSTWFRDYLYMPLGGNRCTLNKWSLNVLITFGVSGLWHGANWTFIIWGLLNGIYLLVGRLTKKMRSRIWSLPIFKNITFLSEIVGVLCTFTLITFSWIFFRANNLQDARYISSQIITHFYSVIKAMILSPDKLFSLIKPSLMNQDKYDVYVLLISMPFLYLIYNIEKHSYIYELFSQNNVFTRWSIYYLLVFGIVYFGAFNNTTQFIYFQF
jgi:alginate O-acetyltransferase complex protein AlgI